MTAPPPRCRVLVVSASMGAGHDHAAAELARRLTAGGHDVTRVDVLALAGRKGARLRAFYGRLLRYAPWVYDAAMRFWARRPGPLERVTALGAGAYERGLAGELARVRPDLVVSTFNLSSQCLGRMKARGEVAVPVVTYVTDPGAHPYWVHRAVDGHLAVTAETAAELAALGAARVVHTGPLVRPEFAAADRSPAARAAARQRLGLPAGERLVLIAAGSEAYGHVERAARLVAAGGDAVPVVLCGRDDALRRRLAARGVGHPLGWVDDVAGLMAAVDLLVDNAGGLTCLEALVAGLPVVAFRPLPGHGRFNAEALERAGLVRRAHRDPDLPAQVRALLTDEAGTAAQVARGRAILAADVAEAALDLAGAPGAVRS